MLRSLVGSEMCIRDRDERESTFKPKINRSSVKSQRNQPLHEISADYHLERTARREAQRAKQMEEEVAHLTFKPKTNRNNGVASKVSAMRDPAGYMQSLKEREARKQAQEEQWRLEKATRELAECSFTPKISKTPKYIKPERVEAARQGVHRASRVYPVSERQWI
eukprot:TRINITY_DN15084_c0_g1_i2.p1 TRINITY_DN15084_c0_g1~~TRINITY_DN15084_c0_g1_i2.p1  ORF type:complete len:192 (-),score=72.75 TRINITY_DN15084_c0_g1_i2:279-773(-)